MVVLLRLVPMILAFFIPALIGTVIWRERDAGYRVQAFLWFTVGFALMTLLYIVLTSSSAPQDLKPLKAGPSRKPDSALSRHPSPRAFALGSLRSCAYLPGDQTFLACSHRWFTWPVPFGIPPVGSYPTLSPITCDRETRSIGWSALCCT